MQSRLLLQLMHYTGSTGSPSRYTGMPYVMIPFAPTYVEDPVCQLIQWRYPMSVNGELIVNDAL
jgi:hypothetical protein